MSAPRPALVVGLGNPGRHYRTNRHNVGFMLLDRLAAELKLPLKHSQSNALVGWDDKQAPHVILAKPQTYVNESGRSVASLMRAFKVELSGLLVVFDEMDLPLGALRMRPFGGSSGHRGMRSIINHLGDPGFPRLRIGIGRPPPGVDPARYVLSDLRPSEQESFDRAIDLAVTCVREFLESGIEIAMNRCNTGSESR
jgi:PTH1 family peptidyl-tRNA hydrolase